MATAFSMWSTACPTVWIFSAASSGMLMSNSSSSSITSSTVSRLSAPRSLTNDVSRVIWSLLDAKLLGNDINHTFFN